jgi:hypothetical protein
MDAIVKEAASLPRINQLLQWKIVVASEIDYSKAA